MNGSVVGCVVFTSWVCVPRRPKKAVQGVYEVCKWQPDAN